MPVKVYIQPCEGRYRATCKMFGFEVMADSKAEASERMNAKIREHVARLEREGRLPEPNDRPACGTNASSPRKKGCSGCSSS